MKDGSSARTLRTVFAEAIETTEAASGRPSIDAVLECIRPLLPKDRYDRPEWREEADKAQIRLALQSGRKAPSGTGTISVRQPNLPGDDFERIWVRLEDATQPELQLAINEYARRGDENYGMARWLYRFGTARGFVLSLPVELGEEE